MKGDGQTYYALILAGLSDILDKESTRNSLRESQRRGFIGLLLERLLWTTSWLAKSRREKKAVGGIEGSLILAVAAFHLADVSWCVRADELVSDAAAGDIIVRAG